MGSFQALNSTMRTNQLLLGIAALPARWGWLFVVPPTLVAVTVVMMIVTIVLWRSRQRSLSGRLYFTALTLAAIVSAVDLVLIGR